MRHVGLSSFVSVTIVIVFWLAESDAWYIYIGQLLLYKSYQKGCNFNNSPPEIEKIENKISKRIKTDKKLKKENNIKKVV